MRYLRVTVQTNRRPMGIALGLVLVLGLMGCARSASVSSPVSLPPDQIQTLHQDDVTWTWAYGSCPTSSSPPAHSTSGDSALVGTES